MMEKVIALHLPLSELDVLLSLFWALFALVREHEVFKTVS